MLKRLSVIILTVLAALITCCHPVSQYINSEDVLRWEEDIQTFDSLNLVEYSDKNTILVTGSSSIRLWSNIKSDLAPYEVMQRGYGGAKLTDFNYYAHRIIKPQQFKAIVVFVANDIAGKQHDRTPKEVFSLYKALVSQVHDRNPGTPLFWIEVTPTPSRWNAIDKIKQSGDLIRSYCDRNEDLYFIDTYDLFINQEGLPDSAYFRSDMLHLNPAGYEVWSKRIKQTLKGNGIHPF